MTTYRELGPQELVIEGDEWFTPDGAWKKTIDPGFTVGFLGNTYRRPMPSVKPYFPEWKYDKAPGCPVHVTWAETPVGTPVVAPDVSGATPGALESIPEPGYGYRLLVHGVDVRSDGDEALLIHAGRWAEICPPYGTRLEPLATYRRKIQPQLKYRPYANASEAASALQGKLIRHESVDRFFAVTQIREGAYFGGCYHSFSALTDYRFTDGTPCGIQIND